MTSIRERAGGLLIGLLVVAFGGLWALQDSGMFDALSGGRNGLNVGQVDGEPIEGELYSNAVEQQTQAYTAQGATLSEALRRQIEDNVFDQLVDATLVEREMDRLGVEVTDEEVVDRIYGPNPDPLIVQVFGDGQGGVDQATLRSVIDNPEFTEQLSAIEEQVRRNRRQAKLGALISASVRVSPAEVREEFVRRNRRASAQLVALRYADVPDDQVEVSDRELRSYYNDHRDDFDRPETYSVEYVAFDKSPTAEDSTRALEELRPFVSGLRSAPNPMAYAAQNSYGAPADTAFVGPGDLPADLATAVFSDLTVGRVVGPVVAGDQAILARIVGVESGGDEAVRARHILFPVDAADRAAEVRDRINSGALDFAQAARQFSTDESNKNRGGDLGWFGRGRMVEGFEDAAFGAPTGRVIGPVETQFGQHLIYVEGRTSQRVQLAQIARTVEADFTRIREEADDFVVFIDEEGQDFTAAAQERGIAPTPMQVTEDQRQVPGLDVGRDFFRFLRSADEGDLSEPFDAGTSLIVVRLVERREAGPAPFEEVSSQVESAVLLEKKKAVQVEALRSALAGATSMQAIAAASGTEVDTVDDLAMTAGVIPGYGVEPRAVGAVFGLRPGQRSGVIEGDQAAFVVQTTSLTGGTDAEFTDAAREELTQQVLQQKRQRVLQAWLQGLRDEADVEDYRNDVFG